MEKGSLTRSACLLAVVGTVAIGVIGFSTWRFDVALARVAIAARERADATTTAALAAAFWHESQAAGLYLADPGPATQRTVTAQQAQFGRLAAQLSDISGAADRRSRAQAAAGNAHYYLVFTQVSGDAGTTAARQRAARDQLQAAAAGVVPSLAALDRSITPRAAAAQAAASTATREARVIGIAAILITIAIGNALGAFMLRLLGRALRRAHQLMSALARLGDRVCQLSGSVSHSVVADCADVSRSVVVDVTELVRAVFPGLSALVIEDVEDAGEVICIRARTRDGAVACPACGTETTRVHEYRERTLADVPAGGRRVLVKVGVRRMRCPVTGCPRQTFREQVPGVPGRYQRRTTRLTVQVSAVARELAGRASARLLPALGIGVSRHAMLRVLLQIPLPALAVPRVLGTGDFALRRGSACATVLTGAGTGRRVDVIEGRTAGGTEKWLRDHPGAEVVCRDGSGAYGEAACRARCRSATAGTCGMDSERPRGRKSPRTRPAGREACPCRRASGPPPPWSAGSRSTTCVPGTRACSPAPAA
jgi:hypothetical protein